MSDNPREFNYEGTILGAKEIMNNIIPPGFKNIPEAYQAGFLRGARFNHENVKLVEFSAYEALKSELAMCKDLGDLMAQQLEAAKALNDELLEKLANKHVVVYRENKELTDQLEAAKEIIKAYAEAEEDSPHKPQIAKEFLNEKRLV